MKNNSELNEFIERLGEALDMDVYCPIDATEAQRQAHGYRYKAARILHEIATNPDIKVVRVDDVVRNFGGRSCGKTYSASVKQAPDALDDLIGGV